MNKRVVTSGSGRERLIALLLVGIVVIAVWAWLSTFYPDYILPSPGAVARRAQELFRQGGLFTVHFPDHFGRSFARVLVGGRGCFTP